MFNLTNPYRAIQVGVILLQGGLTELIDVAPIELLTHVSHKFVDPLPEAVVPNHIKQQAHEFQFHWVSEEGPALPILDIVIIGATGSGDPSETEIQYLRQAYNDSSAFISICFGFLGPLAAGLLEGKTVTAPRFVLDTYRAQVPQTNWVDKRWTRDGKLWTSGALLNGLDVMSSFIQQTWPSGKGTLVDMIMTMAAWPSGSSNYNTTMWT
ncbi:DJ-1/PfpI family protein [Beauveria bassiana ARSEF 2860]|uniref:DJ-1/PfpI family protein n=1 Tax=Beauveria bassiana (strain ARSEF 2860) TaxID=655819 RepID=J4KMD5_BEAB2|nr:DJ-1/PfpI family protein [Beauveria bassiana ARSEF 2860]EJP63764.1 DJ-1/PfpI family protein [Beauveria bassiana ARSEF 2860]